MTSHFEPQEPFPDALACDIAALFEHNADRVRTARRRRTFGAGWTLLLVATAIAALPTGLTTDRPAPVWVATAVAPPRQAPAGGATPAPTYLADARSVPVVAHGLRRVPHRLRYALASELPMATPEPVASVAADPAPARHVDTPSAEVRVAQVSPPPPPPSAFVAIALPPPQVIVDGPTELRREHRRYAAIDAIHNLRRQ